MCVRNINSSIVPKENDLLWAEGRMGRDLAKIYRSLPVYLVDPPLMDKIYPPEKRMFISPECAKRLLREFDETGHPKDVDALWKRLEDCKEPMQFAAIGVYFSSVSEEVMKDVEDVSGIKLGTGPTIFICTERVKSLAGDVRRDFLGLSPSWLFRFALAKILIHELAHAFMDGASSAHYTTPWGRIIEESLANAFAYSRLATTSSQIKEKESAIFFRIVEGSPVEYQGWEFFAEQGFRSLKAVATDWKNLEIPGTSFAPVGAALPAVHPGWFLPFFPPFIFPRALPKPLRYFYEELAFHLPHPWDRIVRDIYRRGMPPKVAFRRWRKDMGDPASFWKEIGLYLLRELIER